MSYCIRVVLLAYNEADSIASVLTLLKEHLTNYQSNFRLYVVNDGSTDNTLSVVEDLCDEMPLTLLNHVTNMGVAQAFDTGLRKATKDSNNGDVIITMEADGTSVPELVSVMSGKIRDGYDIVCASRYCEGGGLPNFPWHRRFFSVNANRLLRLLFPIKGVRDYTLFFRAYRAVLLKEAFQHYSSDFITSTGFVSNAEILIKLRNFRPKATECPMIYDYSVKKSFSKMRVWTNTAEYLLTIWKIMF